MIKMNQRYAVNLCNTVVELEIRRTTTKKGSQVPAVYIVDLALRNPSKPTAAGEFKVELRDSKGRSLPRLQGSASCGAPVVVQKAGIQSEHFAELFAFVSAVPATLMLQLRGQICELPIDAPDASGDDSEELKCEKTDEAEDDGIKEGEGRGRSCCPVTFVTPLGNQPTTRRPVVGAPATYFCRPWTVTATFAAAPAPCDCPCCEYRQFIRGESSIRLLVPPLAPIVLMNLSPSLALPIPLPFGGTIYVPTTIGPAFQEDTVLLNLLQCVAYGHRNDMGTPNFDGALQDYPTPCEYWGFDSPSIGLPAIWFGTGFQLHVDWEFRGEIIDTCSGGVKGGPNNWAWKLDAIL